MENTNNTNIITTASEKKNLAGLFKKNKHLTVWLILIIATIGLSAGFIYFNTVADKISIDKSEITADKIDLTAPTPGLLNQIFVNVGDNVPADTVVAQVGNNLIKTDVAGTIISVQRNIGALYNPGQAVVSMVQNSDLRVVGRLDEDKGLKDVRLGQTAMFKVDAFGNKKYFGIVDEISPTSRDSGIAFNISDKRETKQFDIKIRYNIADYPELKNGMSAKIWIYR